MVFIWCLHLLLGGYTGGEGSVGPPTTDLCWREGGRVVGGGGPAIPILNRKFSHCRIFSPLWRATAGAGDQAQATNIDCAIAAICPAICVTDDLTI